MNRAHRLHSLQPKEERALRYTDRQLLDVLEHHRFRGLWFCRFAGAKRRVWYATFLDADQDFSETIGDPTWRLALQAVIDVIREVEAAL